MNEELKQNWESYVGFQRDGDHFTSDVDGVTLVCYMKPNIAHDKDGSPLLSFGILKEPVECTLTFDEMLVALEKTIFEFPLFEYESPDEVDLKLAKYVIKNAVARDTRRGVANVEYKNALFYRGSKKWDAAIYVAENNGKYGIFKHPLFNKFGRVIVKIEN